MKRVTTLGLMVLPLPFGIWMHIGAATALDNSGMAKTYCECGCKGDNGGYTTKKIALVVGADPEVCKKYNQQECKITGGSLLEFGKLVQCNFVAEHKSVNPHKLDELRKNKKAVPSTTTVQ